MKVLLVNPAFNDSRSRTSCPTSLLTLGSMLRKQSKLGLNRLKGVNVAIETIKTYEPMTTPSNPNYFEEETTKAIQATLEKHKPDVIGMSVSEFDVETVVSTCQKIREINPDIKIILGGPLATSLPRTTLIETEADMLIRGEAEFTFRDTMERLAKNENPLGVPALYMLNNCGEIITASESDQFPILSVDEIERIDLDPELIRASLEEDAFFTPVLSRGCPFGGCPFCSVSIRQKLRRMSDERTIEIIKRTEQLLQELDLHGNGFAIFDPAFGGSKEQLIRFLENASSPLINCPFTVSMAIDQFLDDGEKGKREPIQSLIDKLHGLGITNIELGVENFSDSFLRRIKCSRYTGEEASHVIIALVRKGFTINLDMILTDFKTTVEEFRDNLKLLIKTMVEASIHNGNLMEIKINPEVIPSPGTAYYRRVLRKATREDWDSGRISGKQSFDADHPYYDLKVAIPKEITDQYGEYEIGRIGAVVGFLSHPKVARRMVELGLHDEHLDWLVDKILAKPDSAIAGFLVLDGGPKFIIKSYQRNGHLPLDFESCKISS